MASPFDRGPAKADAVCERASSIPELPFSGLEAMARGARGRRLRVVACFSNSSSSSPVCCDLARMPPSDAIFFFVFFD